MIFESWQLVSKQLEEDFNTAQELGEQQINQFFQKRVLFDEKKFYDRIALNKRKNFSKSPQENTVDKPRKRDRMENRAMVKILSLAEGSKVDLGYLMSYRLNDLLSNFQYQWPNEKSCQSGISCAFSWMKQVLRMLLWDH